MLALGGPDGNQEILKLGGKQVACTGLEKEDECKMDKDCHWDSHIKRCGITSEYALAALKGLDGSAPPSLEGRRFRRRLRRLRSADGFPRFFDSRGAGACPQATIGIGVQYPCFSEDELTFKVPHLKEGHRYTAYCTVVESTVPGDDTQLLQEGSGLSLV